MGDEYRGLALPGLENLLAHARISQTSNDHYMAWLCREFGIEQEDYPAAALTAAFDGLQPGNDFWLRADPVHLRIHRDQVSLLDASAAPLTQAEADGLIATLNRQFAGDGLQFLAPQPHAYKRFSAGV